MAFQTVTGNFLGEEVQAQFSFNLWEKYGKRRIYINNSKGQQVAFYENGELNVKNIDDCRGFREALAYEAEEILNPSPANVEADEVIKINDKKSFSIKVDGSVTLIERIFKGVVKSHILIDTVDLPIYKKDIIRNGKWFVNSPRVPVFTGAN